jgi:hypothetical protein
VGRSSTGRVDGLTGSLSLPILGLEPSNTSVEALDERDLARSSGNTAYTAALIVLLHVLKRCGVRVQGFRRARGRTRTDTGWIFRTDGLPHVDAAERPAELARGTHFEKSVPIAGDAMVAARLNPTLPCTTDESLATQDATALTMRRDVQLARARATVLGVRGISAARAERPTIPPWGPKGRNRKGKAVFGLNGRRRHRRRDRRRHRRRGCVRRRLRRRQ